MSTIAEALAAKAELAGDLAAGLTTLDLGQQITFTKYIKLVLPLDGFVFWVKADLVGASALYNAARFNLARFAEPMQITPSATINVSGSLHYGTVKGQEETDSSSTNNVIFTSLSEIQDFNQVGPNVIYIASINSQFQSQIIDKIDGFDGRQPVVSNSLPFEEIKFAFRERVPFYKQADLYHYRGQAINSQFQSQIIDKIDGFDGRQPVVSNSLPLWLALNGYTPPYAGGFSNWIQLYSSWLVPDNQPPPYGVVHVESNSSIIQSMPALDRTMTHYQLMSDRVRVTLYGVRNADALTFVDCVNQYSMDTDNFGIMAETPPVQDEKHPQTELGIISMRKRMDYRVSYYQTTVRDIARQLILSALPGYSF